MTNPQDNPEAVAALSRVKEGAAPGLEYFRDGAIIETYLCRLTLGKFALLHIAQNKLFTKAGEGSGATVYDIFEALYILADDHLDEVVWIADKKPLLVKAVCDFKDKFSAGAVAKAVDSTCEWLKRILDSMPQKGPGDDSDAGAIKSLWWVESADIIFSEYPWSEHFVLWQLPFVRALKYIEVICARKSGKPLMDDISSDMMAALDKAEEVNNGQGKT